MISETGANGAFEKGMELSSSVYHDKSLGSWIEQMINNTLGLPAEGQFIETSNPEYVACYTRAPEGAFTDEDRSMEWVLLCMLEERVLNTTYYQVRGSGWNT